MAVAIAAAFRAVQCPQGVTATVMLTKHEMTEDYSTANFATAPPTWV